MSCIGATHYKTTYLDELTARCMRFIYFHVEQAICSASRAGLLTGCYSNSVGVIGALNPNARIGINHEEETIAEVLKKLMEFMCTTIWRLNLCWI